MADPAPGWAFIGGTGSCGSSMLLEVLSLHPQIHAIPGETNPDAQRWGSWLAEIARPHEHAAQKAGRRVILEKTPANFLIADELLGRLMPGSRYIHLRRNLERTADSLVRRGRYPIPFGPMINRDDQGLLEARRFVAWCNDIGRGVMLRHPGRALVLDFDRLVTAPEPTLASLCDWLRIGPPAPEMLAFPFDHTKAGSVTNA